MIRRQRALLLAASLLLAACSYFKSPQEDLSFKAPDGWTAMPHVPGPMALWSHRRAGQTDFMGLMRFPKAIPIGNAPKPQGSLDRRSITICGNQPALFEKSVAVSKEGTHITTEAVFTNVLGTSYLASYYYETPTGDPQAEAALYNLCAAR